MADVILRVENVTKTYNKTRALQYVSLKIYEGEFFSIIGPSGSGKSTLLKIIAGVETATDGRVFYRGTSVDPTAPEADIVMVWQTLALFPHMDVEGNVAFGLVIRKVDREERKERVKNALAMVALTGYEKRRIHELSGGEQQRVALARALVVRPNVLLLDEPLGSLDAYLRGELQAELRRLHQDTGITFIMVTHDQSEALALSNRIAVINSGRIEQVGAPEKIMKFPQTAFVARFVGDKNVFEGTVQEILQGMYVVSTPMGVFKAGVCVKPSGEVNQGTKVAYVIEAAHINEGNKYENHLQGTFLGTVIRGSSRIVRLELPNKKMLLYEIYGENGTDTFEEKKIITVSWQAEKAYILPI